MRFQPMQVNYVNRVNFDVDVQREFGAVFNTSVACFGQRDGQYLVEADGEIPDGYDDSDVADDFHLWINSGPDDLDQSTASPAIEIVMYHLIQRGVIQPGNYLFDLDS